jgi:hypothetical protein
MTSKSVTLPVLNSLLFIRDKNIRSLPEIDGHSSVWSTPSCVAVSCLPDSDGETRVVIGSAEDVRQDGDPIFDARLMTPSGHVIVENVLGERLLEIGTPKLDTRVTVWTNGFRDTDMVTIGLA